MKLTLKNIKGSDVGEVVVPKLLLDSKVSISVVRKK
jgi:hypothetical protein